jgi:hypothetical protein
MHKVHTTASAHESLAAKGFKTPTLFDGYVTSEVGVVLYSFSKERTSYKAKAPINSK